MSRVVLRIATPIAAALFVCGSLTVISLSTTPTTTVELDNPVVTYMRESTSPPRPLCRPYDPTRS